MALKFKSSNIFKLKAVVCICKGWPSKDLMLRFTNQQVDFEKLKLSLMF